MPADDKKTAKARAHAAASKTAAANVLAAVREGRPVALADAKALEAAGCWLRRNMTEGV